MGEPRLTHASAKHPGAFLLPAPMGELHSQCKTPMVIGDMHVYCKQPQSPGKLPLGQAPVLHLREMKYKREAKKKGRALFSEHRLVGAYGQ